MASKLSYLGKYSLADEIDSDQKRKKRDKLGIILDLLEAVKEPAKKTHLLYMTKINYYQLIKYLDLLSRLGLLDEISDPFERYVITKKGRILLMLFDGSFKDEHISRCQNQMTAERGTACF